MDFLSDTTLDGVRERRFQHDDVPGVLFSAAADATPGPLLLLAHGGGRHTAHPVLLSQARRYVQTHDLTVLALDAPGHGDRPRSARMDAAIADLRVAMAAGAPANAVAAVNAEVAATAVPEWQAVLDAVLAGDHARGPVGFVGFSQGAAIGIELIAVEPRITVAVVGLMGVNGMAESAARITVPVQVVMQWNDRLVDRDDALTLYATIGSTSKTLHANPGGHHEVPQAQRESSERFLADHLHSGRTHPSAETASRLRQGVVVGVREDSCDVLVEGHPVRARYARSFPSPRVERVAPGHLVALATADDDTLVVVFRWFDAVVVGTTDDRLRMWEPAHGEVLATPRHDHQRQPGTRAYLSAGLPGADWWVAGPAVPAAADVELTEVEDFCTEHDLWNQLS